MDLSTATGGALDSVRRPFFALAEAFVPEIVDLDAAGRERLIEVAHFALKERPASVRRQVRLFVRVMDFVALLRHRRRLAHLRIPERTRLVESFQDSRLLAFRRGVWGLRTLVFMGYYTRADIQDEIGYRAHADGWEASR